MYISECNPFVRFALIQPAVLEGSGLRMAYDYRLFYVLENEGTVLFQHSEWAIGQDSLLIIPPKVGYYFRGKLKVAVLNFDVSRAFSNEKVAVCPPPADQYREELCFDLTTVEGLDQPLLVPGDVVFRKEILQIVNLFNAGGDFSDAATSAALKALLTDILRRDATQEDPEQHLAERIMSYIKTCATTVKSNAELGEQFGYHPVYLGEVFRKKTGLTLHEVILEERVRLACRWLRQTDLSVEEIAYETGFCSRSHFCTVFKKGMGTTPYAYRKMNH